MEISGRTWGVLGEPVESELAAAVGRGTRAGRNPDAHERVANLKKGEIKRGSKEATRS
jgi:hypothetical protein